MRSLIGQTSTPHVACAPPTAHTAHRAYSDIAIVKIKLDSKATTSKICVPSHNRWMIRSTNLDLAGSRTPLSIARGILGSLAMLFEAPSMASVVDRVTAFTQLANLIFLRSNTLTQNWNSSSPSTILLKKGGGLGGGATLTARQTQGPYPCWV